MSSAPLHALYRSAGLEPVPAPEGGGAALPASHGDPAAERASVDAGAGLLDHTARGRVLVTGADAVDLLQRMLANDVKALASGRAAPNLLLTPKGRVRFAFTLARGASGLELWTAPGQGAALAAALDQFVFAEDVGLADESDGAAPLALVGPRADALVADVAPDAAGLEPGAWATSGGITVARETVLGRPGWRLDAGAEGVAALWTALVEAGATPLGLDARETLRIEALEPLAGVELSTDEDAAPYPQEARLDDAFSLAKGCYVGQEVVAKLDTYGGLNRRLHAFACAAGEAVAPGTPILTATGDDAALLTSVCDPVGSDAPAALGYLKLRHADAESFTAGPAGPALTVLSGP